MKITMLFVAVIVLLLTGCVATVKEESLLSGKQGARLIDTSSTDSLWKIRSIELSPEEGVSLYGALFTRAETKGLVMYFGGNGFVISEFYKKILTKYEQVPVDILIFDHRGYGASTGTATLKGMFADAVFAYDYARALEGYKSKPIFVHGQSIGSFLAGEVARVRKLDGLILESSATSTEDWLQGFADNSIFIRQIVVPDNLKGKGNLSVVATLDEPVLFVVGEKDETTRSAMSVKLFEAAQVSSDQKELLIVPNAGHNNASNSPLYWAAFGRLMSRAGVK